MASLVSNRDHSFPKWIHSPSDVGTKKVPIHFTKDDHHSRTWNTDNHHHTRCSPQSPKVKLSHDAPIGSRTPARTGEERPRKEWSN